MGTEAAMDSGEGVRTLTVRRCPPHSVSTRCITGKTQTLPVSPRSPRAAGAQVHKQSYYSRPGEVTGTPKGQRASRGRKGCPRLPFELLEGSEVNRSRTRKAKTPAEATRRNILMAEARQAERGQTHQRRTAICRDHTCKRDQESHSATAGG